jgi:hypothetical protein
MWRDILPVVGIISFALGFLMVFGALSKRNNEKHPRVTTIFWKTIFAARKDDFRPGGLGLFRAAGALFAMGGLIAINTRYL